MAKQVSKPFNENFNQSINIINEGTKIKGDVISSGDIRIDGELTGNISTKGKLVIGPNGKINGEVDCNNIEVAGFIKGKINATELLNMKSTCQIEGDIIAGKLSVEPGSLFSGTCTMGTPNHPMNENAKKE
ncbi:MAG: polymer-forming cytoskeletal protein [Prolixibacteraceae bacterium]|nr:polymer-forming cytoskeletal protein [Prolixibacteraceae bacterium]